MVINYWVTILKQSQLAWEILGIIQSKWEYFQAMWLMNRGEWDVASGYVKIAIEHRNSEFSHQKMVIFQFAMLVITRG